MAGRLQRYMRIKNEVAELLASGVLTYRQLRIVLIIIRESWGWNAGRSNWTHRPLTVTDIAQKAQINRAHATREIQKMIEQNILQIMPQEIGAYYSFNEHQNTWQKADKRSKRARGGSAGKAHDPKEHALPIQKSTLPDPNKHGKQPSKSRAARVPTILKKDLKEKDLKEINNKEASQDGRNDKTKNEPPIPRQKANERSKRARAERDPENFFMTPKEVEQVMACSPDARELAKLFWDESKKRGATGFPDGFFWKCVTCFEKLLKRGTKAEIAKCMIDLFDDGFTVMDSPYKVSDKFAAWQISQKSGGWRKRGENRYGRSNTYQQDDGIDYNQFIKN